jgi:fatty-acid desaturase
MIMLVVALTLANAGLILAWATSHRAHPDDPA